MLEANVPNAASAFLALNSGDAAIRDVSTMPGMRRTLPASILILILVLMSRSWASFSLSRTLALQHRVPTVVGRFNWSGVRTNDSLHKNTLRTENGRREILARALHELDLAMLQEWDGIPDEGKLTESLAQLHDSYLTLTEEVARLELDEYEIKARAIQMAERADGIQDVCSYKRSSKLVFNREMFCEALLKANDETELQKCYLESSPCINRRILRSRSY
jgi:hypothetical protein